MLNDPLKLYDLMLIDDADEQGLIAVRKAADRGQLRNAVS